MSASSRIAIVAAFAALLLPAAPSVAAPIAALTDATGQASVLKPLSILKRSDLDFGELAAAAAGTAVIDPVSGSLTTTGGVTKIGTSAHVATFTATGSKNSIVHIRIPTAAVTLTRVGGGGTMTVSNWTLDGSTNRKVPASSTFDFSVGGTLNVAAAQPDGTYSGTFSVTVQYP